MGLLRFFRNDIMFRFINVELVWQVTVGFLMMHSAVIKISQRNKEYACEGEKQEKGKEGIDASSKENSRRHAGIQCFQNP
jgi:dolichyl-phosphate-mannose--protein O-mannosyl transferase